MIQDREMMQNKDLKLSKSNDEGSRSRSQSMNEQSRYKQEKTNTKPKKERLKSHIKITFNKNVHHDMFENMFVHVIQNHEELESIPDTYVVNENNSNIISDIPNIDSDRGKEEHEDVDYEQQHAFFASLINNLKCDVEKCNMVNREAQQANALLTNELERSKEKEKHFTKDKTIESEYYKKIKILNDEISNLKSQACKKDKTFARENEKFDEQTDQTLRMLLPKEDNVNMGKQGLGFENQNDDLNLSLLNKANELAPCLYNIDEMGKDSLFDHKIISDEELKSTDVKEEMTKRCAQYEKDFAKLEARYISLKLKSKNKSSTSMQNGQVLSNKSDEAKIKFDTDDLETINIELEYNVASLLKENEHLKNIYQKLIDSIKRSRVQTKRSKGSQNEAKNLKSQLSEFADKIFDKVFQKIESMKKKKFNSRISNDFLKKSLHDSDPSNVESESEEKKILFRNKTSRSKT
ncbi:hypothetical protein Tco_0955397 [Tanacetum coccineum]|uniref:Uncharacterized protein n=1 Tax=Tanacetum coccineum TaxID=301880 RepID=A0ABQ5E758_9ASTR